MKSKIGKVKGRRAGRGLTSLLVLVCWAALPEAIEGEEVVSFRKQVLPLLKEHCSGCHRPGKAKGGLELTSYAGIRQGGDSGRLFSVEVPGESLLLEEVSGEPPSMPEEGKPLTGMEVTLLRHWIEQGALDDGSDAGGEELPTAPELYQSVPAISALAASNESRWLAIGGWHELLLSSWPDKNVVRVPSASARIERIVFSAEDDLVLAVGGRPTEVGIVELWQLPEGRLKWRKELGNDSLLAGDFSPGGEVLAVGGIDREVHVLALADGSERGSFGNHIDWIRAIAFGEEGHLLAADQAGGVKLYDWNAGTYIDDINQSIGAVTGLAVGLHEEHGAVAVAADDSGLVRSYQIQQREFGDDVNRRKDVNRVREFERQNGPVTSMAVDGAQGRIGLATQRGEVRVYELGSGSRRAQFQFGTGPVFGIAFLEGGKLVALGGYDGWIRVVEVEKGEVVEEWIPFPVKDS